MLILISRLHQKPADLNPRGYRFLISNAHSVLIGSHLGFLIIGLDKQNFDRKCVNNFLPISFSICLRC